MPRTSRFRAMGTSVEVLVDGLSHFDARQALRDATASIHRMEALWSRFLPTSDVSRINSARGAWTSIDPSTTRALSIANLARELTGHRFDPLIGAVLHNNGYATSYSGPGERGRKRSVFAKRSHVAVAYRDNGESRLNRIAGEITLNTEEHSARIPEGSRIDLGGIGKGWAADVVCEQLLARGCSGAMVNVGGDVRVAGTAPDGVWRVDLDLPRGLGPLTVVLEEGAVAVSSTTARTWTLHGVPWHHLIVPSVGAPSVLGGAAAVIAGTGWWAEALTKVALCSGCEPSSTLVDQFGKGAHALVVPDHGSISATEAWHTFVRTPLTPSQGV